MWRNELLNLRWFVIHRSFICWSLIAKSDALINVRRYADSHSRVTIRSSRSFAVWKELLYRVGARPRPSLQFRERINSDPISDDVDRQNSGPDRGIPSRRRSPLRKLSGALLGL